MPRNIKKRGWAPVTKLNDEPIAWADMSVRVSIRVRLQLAKPEPQAKVAALGPANKDADDGLVEIVTAVVRQPHHDIPVEIVAVGERMPQCGMYQMPATHVTMTAIKTGKPQ
jgi:hypothetical protein